MQKRLIKLILATWTALALFSVNSKVLADNQVAADIVNTVDDKDAEISRVITLIDPRTGEKTVISQPASAAGTGEGVTTWPEYPVPEIKGYQPSQGIVPAKVVTPQTKPDKVTITYQPTSPNELQDTGGGDETVGTGIKSQVQPVVPRDPVQTAPAPKESNEAVDPLFGQKLKQLQAPLNELEDEHKMSNQYELPQTGNRADTVTTLSGIAITVFVALTSLFFIGKKFNKF